MPGFQARISTQQQLGYVPHTSVSGDTWQITQTSETTGAGAAGGTTVVDANFGGSNDDYNGRYWIEILSGTSEGQWKRVVDYVSASGTFTLENNGFDNQIASGVEFRVWLSPEPVVVVDSSSGETDMVDAVRAEANGYWTGYYAVPITGTHRGKIAQITDHVSGSGTFTLAASFGSSLAAGDVVLLRRFVEAGNVSAGLSENYVARPSNRVNFSIGDGTRGQRGGTMGFSLQIRPTGALSADTVAAGRPEAAGLLTACGLVEVVGTSTKMDDVGAASTTTSLLIDTGTKENFAIGSMIVHDGNVTFVTDTTDGGGSADTLTVSPPLPVAPADNDAISGSSMYRKSLDGDTYGCTIEYEVDGVRTTCTGCFGNVNVNDAEVPEFAFDFQVDHWIREIEAAPYNAGTAYEADPPVLAQERIAYLDTTKTDVSGFTATPGTQTGARMVMGSNGINGRSSFQVTGFQAGGTWQELLDSSGTLSQELRWTARTSSSLAVIYGSHGTTCAVRIPAARHIGVPTPADSDGLVSVPNVYEAQDAGTVVDGDSTIQKIPDFAIHLT